MIKSNMKSAENRLPTTNYKVCSWL